MLSLYRRFSSRDVESQLRLEIVQGDAEFGFRHVTVFPRRVIVDVQLFCAFRKVEAGVRKRGGEAVESDGRPFSMFRERLPI